VVSICFHGEIGGFRSQATKPDATARHFPNPNASTSLRRGSVMKRKARLVVASTVKPLSTPKMGGLIMASKWIFTTDVRNCYKPHFWTRVAASGTLQGAFWFILMHPTVGLTSLSRHPTLSKKLGMP
jgi:hypothetical protein